MKIFKEEKNIEELIANRHVSCDVNYIVDDKAADTAELAKACIGNACAFSAIKDKAFNITDDVMPISSILVTDIWNANDDVFTAEQIVRAENTPNFKPINWMHRGSEDSQNENIGVMVRASLIHGELPEINFMDQDIKDELGSSVGNTLSSKVHIKQDGIIWSQYFPSYASKIKAGISDKNLYVSMECFFEDFGYCLRKNEDDENPLFLDRKPSTAHMSKSLRAYGGSGEVKYKGEKYQIGRWLKGIVFSGQGIVVEPANKRKGKILSIILNEDNKSKADIIDNFDPASTNPPTGPVQDPGAMINPEEVDTTTGDPSMMVSPSELSRRQDLPKTHESPADGLLFYSAKEAEKVGQIELGCTGYHLYQQDRHGDKPLLFSKLIGDPSDLEEQMKVAQYRPCANERELRFILEDMAKKGIKLRRAGRLSETQESSYQQEGGGADTQQSLAPTSGPTSVQTPSGAPSQQPAKLVGGENLKELNEEVYKKIGENKMEEITEKEIEEALVLATERIESLSEINANAAKEIAIANQKIDELTKELEELRAFAIDVENLADLVTAKKLGESRYSEIKNILNDIPEGITAEDLAEMNDKSYASLKKSLEKTVSVIEKRVSESETAASAAKAIAAVKKAESVNLIITETVSHAVDPASKLIGFAFGRKR